MINERCDVVDVVGSETTRAQIRGFDVACVLGLHVCVVGDQLLVVQVFCGWSVKRRCGEPSIGRGFPRCSLIHEIATVMLTD